MPAASLPSSAVPFKIWVAVFGSMLGAFMAVLDIQITNASLNDILGSLGATLDEGGWVATSYLVAEIIVIPLSGWLAGVFSMKRLIMSCAALFVLFSMCCGFAWNLESLILFRCLQGCTGGMLIPLAFQMVLRHLPPEKRPMGFALFGMTATFAPAIGPTFGGWLTNNFGWPSIFYMNLVPGILMLAATAWGAPREPMQLQLLRKGDWSGILTMAIGLGCLTVFLEEGNKNDWFGSDFITRLAIISALSLIAFVFIQLYKDKPLLNLRLLGRRNFGLAILINVTMGMSLYGSAFLLPLYLAQVQGYNAMQIGQVIMWMGMPQPFIMPLMPVLMKRMDSRLMCSIGVVLFASGVIAKAWMTHDSAIDQLKFAQLGMAFGMPMLMTPLMGIGTGTIEPANAANASVLWNMLRNLGGSVGIALLGTMVTVREHFHSAMIGESVSLYSTPALEQLNTMTQGFIASGYDAVTAQQQALGAMANLVRREAYVMAYNDAFFVIGSLLFLTGSLVWLTKPGKPAGGPSAAH